jgi:Mg-chelatase subunit ChlD
MMRSFFALASLFALTAVAAAACSAASGSELGDDDQGASQGSGAAHGSSASGTAAFDGGGGKGDDASFDGEQCGSSTVANQVPGTLLVVLDKSGSMSEAPGGGAGPSKWQSTVAALGVMIQSASPSLEVGLLPFPAGKFNFAQLNNCLLNPSAPGCDKALADAGCSDVDKQPVVPIAPLSQNGAAIDSWLKQTGPDGNTPTRHALKNGYAIVQAEPAQGQRYALLITDGEPTVAQPPFGPFPALATECGQLADIEAEVAAAAAASPSVNTFVIGSPGSEPAAQFLSQLAVNGKTPKDPSCTPAAGNCHYQIGTADFQNELEQVLSAIAGVVGDCIFDVPKGQGDVDPNKVNVVIETPNGPVEIYKDPSHQDGWDYTDATNTKIQLFGPACDLFKAQKGNAITIVLGCATVLK